ncbi:MAG: hypothetical protein ACRDH8_13615 [Actinomycetota bacterium]
MSWREAPNYARYFFRNLMAEMPYRRWVATVVRNRLRARLVLGCCGHRGEPGC